MSDRDPRGITAIILAAGVNRRMGETPTPKAFMSLTEDGAGPSFIDRHLAVLDECGIDDVVIVHAGTIPYAPDGARLVENPFDTSATGSTLSLLCALRLGEPHPDHGLLIMDGDIVYERSAMQFIVDRSKESTLFVAPETTGDEEEVRVYGHQNSGPVLIGKALPHSMVGGMDLLGESLGVIHVAAPERELLRTTAEWLTGWPPDQPAFGYSKSRSEHEEVWQYFFSMTRMAVVPTPEGALFSECDTPDDYRFVTAELYRSILERDRAAQGRTDR